MQTISASLGLAYRTKALSPDQAARFARCLQANPHFAQVRIHASPRSTGRCFVAYTPTNPDRCAEMLAREADKRSAKAAAEGSAYGFALDPDSPQPFAWCLNPVSGETYEVTLFDCSCPDFRFRCQGVGVRCKHMVAFAAVVDTVPEFQTVGRSAEAFDPAAPFGPEEPFTAEEEERLQEWLARREEEFWWE